MDRASYRKVRKHPVSALLRKAAGFKGKALTKSEIREHVAEHGGNVNALIKECTDIAAMSADGKGHIARGYADEIALGIIKKAEKDDALLPVEDEPKSSPAATKKIVDKLTEDKLYDQLNGLKFQDGSVHQH